MPAAQRKDEVVGCDRGGRPVTFGEVTLAARGGGLEPLPWGGSCPARDGRLRERWAALKPRKRSRLPCGAGKITIVTSAGRCSRLLLRVSAHKLTECGPPTFSMDDPLEVQVSGGRRHRLHFPFRCIREPRAGGA
jgi:hypothetical protein